MANAIEQSEVGGGKTSNEPRLFMNDTGSGMSADETRRQAHLARAEQTRHRQELNLQRENILSQKTSNPARRAALEAALAQIEGQIASLD
ncbi:MAG: hypothetical protein ACP5FH_07910 [Terracidiphilus sp.]